MESIEFLGHSGFAVRGKDTVLLCDPWMSLHGAYNASWFQYPAYTGDIDTLITPTAVYLSHEHLDHYDPEFMARIDRATPIITGRFHKKRLFIELRKQGFKNIIELDGLDGYDVSEHMRVRVSTPSFNCPPHWFDSCCLIETGGKKIFNLNDCNLALPLEQIRNEGVDVLLGQASPAIWYPLTYTCYDPAQLAELKAARRHSALESFVTAVKSIAPRLAVPTAGPPIFFDPELSDFFVGEDSMFPTPPVAAQFLKDYSDTPTAIIKPGDKLVLDADEFRIDAHPDYVDFDFERDRRSYFEANKDKMRVVVAETLAAVPLPAPGLFDRLSAHLTPLIQRNPYFTAHINMRVLFDITGPEGGRWIADFRDGERDQVLYPDDGEGAQYSFTIESRFIEQVLRGEMGWEDLFLSLRFKASRTPDIYNQHLFTFFKMGDHASLQQIARDEMAMAEGPPSDLITVESGGETYEVQRFCPHAGSDMKDAQVVDGHIICPGHHWKFDLQTGICPHADARIHTVKK